MNRFLWTKNYLAFLIFIRLRRICTSAFFLLTLFSVDVLHSQNPFDGFENLFTTPHQYTIYRTTDSIYIDGLLSESSWQLTPWSDYFTDIEGNQGPVPPFKTRFKMLWDESHLYIAAEIEEPDIWATLTQHDQIIFQDNDFEFFIDPNGNGYNYYEIEVNALKTIFDLFLPKPYRDSGRADISWNANNMSTGIHVEGTLNHPGDTDKEWTVEFSIPFEAFDRNTAKSTPANETIWRMNFSRVEWETEVKDGKYMKRIDSLGNNLPEHNWVWSPQGIINMHFPERWGYVRFSDHSPPLVADTFQIPFAESLKKYLWLTYYQQHRYFSEHHHYALTLSELKIPDTFLIDGNQKVQLDMKSDSDQFKVIVSCKSLHEKWSLDQEGKLLHISL